MMYAVYTPSDPAAIPLVFVAAVPSVHLEIIHGGDGFSRALYCA